ncbi:receptor-like serine/threonine-protein kinase SD1-8 [Arachis hypogaea]|uniref:receptor-like serine/threonine-protein kinase SD1-8 n=1 Tax=Arachis hypogaea TaxID=3818 RepID=UPI000DED8363|nr:receptor-like serine/threonine-protein kinase SD1-8 [Arachis hypogaea]
MRIFITPLNYLIIIVISFFFFFIIPSTSSDTLTGTQNLTTNQTLLSQNQSFVLGFFRGSNTNYYLGIWYNNIIPQTIIWVANRDNPIDNSTGYLKIGENGNFVLLNSSGNPAWSSNQTSAKNPVLQLLDTGNLVLKDSEQSNNYLWQSFDYPTDTLLAGMKLGWDLDTGIEKYLTSWKVTGVDPSSGHYTYKLDYRGLPEIFLRRNQTIIYRTGPWNGERFSGVPKMNTDTDSIVFSFSDDAHGVFYSFSIGNASLLSRLTMTSDSGGELQRWTWTESSESWNEFWYAPADQCDHYRECGPYGVCDNNASPVCTCMKGFSPKNPQAWNLRDGSGGCVRNTGLNCSTDKFLHLENMKLPETSSVFINKSMTLDECGSLCKRNCSCTAYANIDIRNGGSGCVMWLGQLIDIRVYATYGQDLFVRLAAADIGSTSSSKSRRAVLAIGITLSALVLVLGLVAICYLRKKRQQRSRAAIPGFVHRSPDSLMNEVVSSRGYLGDESNMDDIELPLFDCDTLTMATNNFSQDNKLGEGGFGSVYMGRLIEGRKIAVKRLSKNSGQGIEEFKNEAKLIVKLQHRNLVRLLGCCIENDEKMLVYEYMENRGLDSILFDNSESRVLLDWERRFNIIYGIARGLLYLHQDSRFRIIHRDLKISNILLDSEMIPKISDFGMARIFDKDQTQAKTLRVVGTYGYMSPEYAMHGNFSVKSDVFSFGVMVLEIITGKKNREFYSDNNELNLLGNVWKHWHEGTALTLLDPSICNSYTEAEVVRCIHIGLLCVQEHAEDRPTMSSVILMLSSETSSLPNPKTPGFSIKKIHPKTESSSSSVNQVTVTMLDAR